MSSGVSLGSEERSRYLPSRLASALILALSTRSSPLGVTRRNRFRPGMAEIFPRSSARLVTLQPPVLAIISPSLAARSSRVAESRVLPGHHHTRTGVPPGVTPIPIAIGGRSSRLYLDLRRPRNPAALSRSASSALAAFSPRQVRSTDSSASSNPKQVEAVSKN